MLLRKLNAIKSRTEAVKPKGNNRAFAFNMHKQKITNKNQSESLLSSTNRLYLTLEKRFICTSSFVCS